MKIDTIKSHAYHITGAPALDPITLFVRDVALGEGQLVIECYGQSWATYWGGMGGDTVIRFVASVGVDYLMSRFRPPKCTKKEGEYLTRVLTVVKQACFDIESFRQQGDEVE
jgi:hypothetical protein